MVTWLIVVAASRTTLVAWRQGPLAPNWSFYVGLVEKTGHAPDRIAWQSPEMTTAEPSNVGSAVVVRPADAISVGLTEVGLTWTCDA